MRLISRAAIFMLSMVVGFFLILILSDDGKGDAQRYKKVIINENVFFVPDDVLATSVGSFLGYRAKLSFQLNAHTLKLAKQEDLKDRSLQNRRSFIQIQLLERGTLRQDVLQQLWAEAPRTDCQEYSYEGVEYIMCRYERDGDYESHRFIVKKKSNEVISVVRCDDTKRYTPPNPNCGARSIVYGDILISQLYSVLYVDKAVQITHVVLNLIEKMRFKNEQRSKGD